MLFQSAYISLGAAIAHIGRLGEQGAAFFLIIGTFGSAPSASRAFIAVRSGAGCTGRLAVRVVQPVGAVIERPVGSAFPFKNDVSPDLLGNGSAVFLKQGADCFEA